MKILLIYPTSSTNGLPNKFKKAYLPPLSLSILDRLTHMANPYHEVRIINDVVEAVDFDIDCDWVGISALTSQAARAYQIADAFRLRGKKVVLGGIHPSTLPDEAIKHADCVIIGEAENIWTDFISDAEKGLVKQFYKDKDYPDLQNLIIPKWDNFNLSVYRRSYRRKLPRMPIFTTRGCVHNCKYCSVTKFFGRKYRYKPIANVLEEIRATGAESYFFTDDNIICNADYSEELFRAIQGRFNNIRWLSQCSTFILKKPHLIELAGRAGCRSMIFGIESINKDSLDNIKKSFNKPEQFVELHQRCVSSGVQPIFSFIFGMDHDLIKNMWDTLEYLKKHKIWNAVFWILTPLPGTDLFDELLASDRIFDFDWANYDLNHVVFKPLNIFPEDLTKNFWALYKSFYSISHIFDKLISARTTEDFFEFYITFLSNQIHSRRQVYKHIHPFSMGISKV